MCYFCYSNQQKQLVLCSSDCSLFNTLFRFFFLFLLSSYRLPPLLFPHKSTPTPAHTTLNITYICHERKREAASPSQCCARALAKLSRRWTKVIARFSPPHRQRLHSPSTLFCLKTAATLSCLCCCFSFSRPPLERNSLL